MFSLFVSYFFKSGNTDGFGDFIIEPGIKIRGEEELTFIRNKIKSDISKKGFYKPDVTIINFKEI